MNKNVWVTIDSPHDVAATGKRVMAAVDAQSDTVHLVGVDSVGRPGEEGVTRRCPAGCRFASSTAG
jgi:hypothetical protein